MCGCVSRPHDARRVAKQPTIYPDYANVTIPPNIAPLNFMLMDGAEAVVVDINGAEYVRESGCKALFDADAWRELLSANKGKRLSVQVYGRYGDTWKAFKPFEWTVAEEQIDPNLVYRLISPSYVSYEDLTLCQRNLEGFDEQVMVNNMLCSDEQEGQCVNCHSFQNYNPRRMQFHARQNHGGTFLMRDGEMRKVALKNDSTLSAGVYPAWHPRLDIIAYSTNKTVQSFHTRELNKIEVYDAASNLILYDIARNAITTISARADRFDTYPAWSPDGQWLYYSSAKVPYQSDTVSIPLALKHVKEIRYNIYRRHFDAATRRFGAEELVFDAAGRGLSATLPRLSPDGRHLLFSTAAYGCFHIWHHDADLWLMDLSRKEACPLRAANSKDTESYHTWSSNGSWVVFSSRRTDGNYTRPFFTHIDKKGRATKAFELPQRDPECHLLLMKSYNIPELTRGRVPLRPQQAAKVMRSAVAN